MIKLLPILLILLCVNAEAKLCSATTDTGKKVFLFVNDKPTKTISGTVSKITECKPLPVLIEDLNTDKDACVFVTLTYVNAETKQIESFFYKNGATSSDLINWDREQNPGCPPL
jgi:hypothetical protein